MSLRDYQARCLNEVRAKLRRVKRVCLQGPTGMGKTKIAAFMLKGASEKGLRCWFVVHRKELLRQSSEVLRREDIPHGIIASDTPFRQALVHVASIQTLAKRIRRLQPPDLIILDEAHHAVAKTWAAMLRLCPNSYVIGLTATPSRTDGSGLDDIFEELVVGPKMSDLIAEGYLSPYRIIAPPRTPDVSGVHRRAGDYAKGELEARVEANVIVGDAVSHYKKYVGGSCLVYCVSRHHARIIEKAYRDAGIDARYCAGDTPPKERDAIVSGFRTGNPPVIVSVDLFGEGLDVPGLSAVQLLRPTLSLGLYLQQVGRALRPEVGKDVAIILDHVNNWRRHGLPDDEREWSLESRPGKEEPQEEGDVRLRHCAQCLCIYTASLLTCPNCGGVHKPGYGKELPEHIEGDLEEVDLKAARIARRREEGMAREIKDLIRLAKIRGYAKGQGWVAYKIQARSRGQREFADIIREVYELWPKVDITKEEVAV